MKIASEKDYQDSLEKVYSIMRKGEKSLSQLESATITNLANAIEKYEKINYPFPMPKTITEIVELKMLEKKLNRMTLAKVLGIGAPKISQILNNKRAPDVSFLKAVHEKLGVDGNFLLEKA